MTTPQYLRLFLRWWWVVLLCTGLGLAVSATVDARIPSTYSSSSSVVVSPTARARSTPSDAYAATLLAQQRMVSYADLARTQTLPLAMQQDGGTDLTADALSSRIEVVQHTGSTVLGLVVRDTDRERAAQLATQAASSMAQVIDQLEAQRGKGKPFLAARVSGEATVAEQSVPAWRNPVLGTVGGLVLGLALAILVGRRLDSRLHDPESVAHVLGSPVLGILPRAGGPRGVRRLVTRRRGGPDRAVDELRAALFFRRSAGKGCVSLALVSPRDPGEAGSLGSALATALAETGAKVLLVDVASASYADTPGLAEHLEGVGDSSLVHHDLLDGVDVLPAGRTTDELEDLLYSPRFDSLLEEAAERYDFVVLVAPSSASGAGALAVSGRADDTVVVVERGIRARQLEHVREQMALVDARVLGSVLLV